MQVLSRAPIRSVEFEIPQKSIAEGLELLVTFCFKTEVTNYISSTARLILSILSHIPVSEFSVISSPFIFSAPVAISNF